MDSGVDELAEEVTGRRRLAQILRLKSLEYRLQRRWIASLHRVDRADERVDSWGHDQKIAQPVRAAVPVGVGFSARDEQARSCVGFEYLVSGAYLQDPLDHVPGLVVGVVNMERRNRERWSAHAAVIFPLGDDKTAFGGSSEVDERRRLGCWCSHSDFQC